MSRDESTTKKRRLESEVSQSSGITYLSNVTQTTELSTDIEDNNSDSSSAAPQTEVIYNRCPSTTNTSTNKQINNSRARRAKRQLVRKRQVSWSIDDDDETFDNERDTEDNPGQQWVPAPYDNNFHGTNDSRRRVRRATESSLDTNALSFNKPQSPFNGAGEQINKFQPKMRSSTTSQIHGHEQELQRKINELIKRHDAQLLQNRRSQSVTSLRNDRLHNRSDSHLYESLQSQNTTQKKIVNNRPVETVVELTSNDLNYLHPVTETKVQGNNIVSSENNSGFSADASSAYADVLQHTEVSMRGQSERKCYNICGDSFYRKGFYILLIFNVILVLLNTFGLPFVYFAVRQEDVASTEEAVFGAVRSKFCFDVAHIHENVNRNLCGDINADDEQCCFESIEQILPRFLKVTFVFNFYLFS